MLVVLPVGSATSSTGCGGAVESQQLLELSLEAAQLMRRLGVDVRLRLREEARVDPGSLRWADTVLLLDGSDGAGLSAAVCSPDALTAGEAGEGGPGRAGDGARAATPGALALLWLEGGTGSTPAR